MAIDFSAVFAATDAAFGSVGTYADSQGTIAGVTYIWGEITSELETASGVFVPDYDRQAWITKAGTMWTRAPARGGVIVSGTESYDIVTPPQEGPTSEEWVVHCKRRC